MEHFADLLNRLFGGTAAAVMGKLGIPANPAHPIPAYVGGEIIIMIILIVGAVILRSRLSVEHPGKFQLAMEEVEKFTREMSEEVVGPEGRKYVALVGTLGLFILLCNLAGLIPTLESPTAHGPVPLGCAALVFLHYNWQGIRHHGLLGYLKHLSGPLAAIAVLMFPIEVFSNILRLLSLSVRLWANMLAGGLVERIFTGLVPLVVPSVFVALHAFESLLQAYIFMILPLLYISLAVTEEH